MTPEDIIKSFTKHEDWSELKISDPETYHKLSEKVINERLSRVMPYYNIWQTRERKKYPSYSKSIPSLHELLKSLDYAIYNQNFEGKKVLTELFYTSCISYGAEDILKASKEFDDNIILIIKNLINRSFKKYFSNRTRIINNLVKYAGFKREDAENCSLLAYCPLKNATIGLEWMFRNGLTTWNDLLHDWIVLLCIDSVTFISDQFVKPLSDKLGINKFNILLDILLIHIIKTKCSNPIYKRAISHYKSRYNYLKNLLRTYDVVYDITFNDFLFTKNCIKYKDYQCQIYSNLSSKQLSDLRRNINKNRPTIILVENLSVKNIIHFRFLYNEDVLYFNQEIKTIIHSSVMSSNQSEYSAKHQINENTLTEIRERNLIARNVKPYELIVSPGVICYRSKDGITYSLKSVKIKSRYPASILQKIDYSFTLVKERIKIKGREELNRFAFEPANDLSFLLSELQRLSIPYNHSEDYGFPLTGIFDLPWKYVQFHDGLMYLIHPNPSKRDTYNPFNFRNPDIHQSYESILPYIETRCPLFKVRAVDGVIVELLNFTVFQHMIPAFDEYSQNIEGIEYSSIGTNHVYHTVSSQDFRIIVEKSKSPYLKFLSSIQLNSHKIYYLIERVIHISGLGNKDEYGYLFTIKEDYNAIILLYENVSDESRSSLVFSVKQGYLESGIKRIKQFLSSELKNKRQKLAWGNIKFTEPYIIQVTRISHINLHDWKNYIKSLSIN